MTANGPRDIVRRGRQKPQRMTKAMSWADESSVESGRAIGMKNDFVETAPQQKGENILSRFKCTRT